MLIPFVVIISIANAGFLQLTDPYVPISLDGSEIVNTGFTLLTGDFNQFAGHPLNSKTFTFTLWVLEKAACTGTCTILHAQQAGSQTQSFAPGDRIPHIYKTSTEVTACFDTTVDPYFVWISSAISGFQTWTWTQYFLSVDETWKEIRLCYTYWRGSNTWVTQTYTDELLTFGTDSLIYLGGSQYGNGIQGKIADVRFYDTTSYTTIQAKALAINRRCASTCYHNCWGPDESSCEGLQFVDEHYSTYLDTSNTVNLGYLSFQGTDVKFKGHPLGTQEMTVQAWVNSPFGATNQEFWRLRNNNSGTDSNVGDRILRAYVDDTTLKVTTGLDNDFDFACNASIVRFPQNKWIHYAISVSQIRNELICCATEWGQTTINCVTTDTQSGNVTAFDASTSSRLLIGSSTDTGIGGRIADFRFFPQSLTASELEDRLQKSQATHNCAPSCLESCWGPDTFSCSDYIQLIDPRFSETYTNSNPDYDTWDPANYVSVKDKHTWGASTYSVAFWVYRNSYGFASSETLLKAYLSETPQFRPYIRIESNNTIRALFGHTDTSENSIYSQAASFTSTWQHVAFSANESRMQICVTEFDLSSPVTNCDYQNFSPTPPALGWDPDGTSAAIYIGDDSDITYDNFQGKMVDVRYYPAKALTTTEVEAIVAATTCIGGTDDCTGPDHTSVTYLYLSEKNWEYQLTTSGGESKDHFKIPSGHVNWMQNSFASYDYQTTMWTIGEDRLQDYTHNFRLQIHSGNCCINSWGRKTPQAELRNNNTIRTWVDTASYSEQWVSQSLTSANVKFKRYFNVWSSIWNWYDMHSWVTEWNGSTNWATTNLVNSYTKQFTSSGWAYFGSYHGTKSYHRCTNLIYYPNSYSSTTQISTKLGTIVWDAQCNSSCYGPGIQSCIYDEPLQLTDEVIPESFDGSSWTTKRGYDAEFEGRFMSYTEYSLCTWFYLETAVSSTTYLLVMTQTQLNVNSTYRNRAPALYISGTTLYATVLTYDGNTYTASVNTVNIETWHFACVVVSQSAQNVKVYLGTLYGDVTTATSSTMSNNEPGYFDDQGYFYYGGVQTGNGESSVNGKMLDIRFWDTKALTADEVTWLNNKECYPAWASCSGLASNECTSCNSPYSLDGSSCVLPCPAGQFSDGSTCTACHSAWKTCTGAGIDECTRCKNPWYRQNTLWKLDCDITYYASTSTSPDYQCVQWQTGCSRCDGIDDCSSCVTGWFLLNGRCETCHNGTYLQPDGLSCDQTCPNGWKMNTPNNTCIQCPQNCLYCVSETQCSTCDEPYVLREDGSCDLACLADWYQDWLRVCHQCTGIECIWKGKYCNICTDTCTSCDSDQKCNECEPGLALDEGVCKACNDVTGYSLTLTGQVIDGLQANLCQPIVGDGLVVLGEECDDANVQDSDGWSSSGLIEIWLSCSDGVCEDIKAPEGKMEYIGLDDDTYSVLLYFDEPVLIQEDFSDVMSVSFNTEVSGSVDKVTSNDRRNLDKVTSTNTRNHNAYQIDVKVLVDVPSGTIMTITIDSTVTDLFSKELSDFSIDVDIESKELIATSTALTTSAKVLIASAMAIGGLVVVASSMGVAGASGGTNFFNPVAFWRFIEVLQVINYMLYLSTQMPLVLRNFFGLLGMANADFLNIFELFLDTGEEAPTRFATEGLSLNLLRNSGHIITVIVLNLSLALAFTILQRKNPTNSNYVKARNLFFYTVSFRISIAGFLNLWLSMMLATLGYLDWTGYTVASAIFSIAILGMYAFVLYDIFMQGIFQPQVVLDDERHKKLYGSFYESYNTNSWVGKSFMLAEITRRMWLCVILVYFTDYPTGQLQALVVLQLIWTLFNILIRPGTSLSQNLARVTMEAVLLIALLLIYVMDSGNVDQSMKYRITWTVVALLGLLVGLFSLYVLAGGLVSLYYVVRNVIQKRKDRVVQATLRNNDGELNSEQNMVKPFKSVSSSKTINSPQALAQDERSRLKGPSSHDVTRDEDGFPKPKKPKYAFVKE